jgi:type I restriction enzyme M protein
LGYTKEEIQEKQNKINGQLWAACDTFRGTIGSDKYKDYILSMLFIKYLSDRYDWRLDQLKEKYKNDEEMVKIEMELDKFHVPEECRFDYIYQNRKKENIGEIINTALQKIEEENSDKLSGVFKDIDFNSEAVLGDSKQRNSMLREMLDDFNNEVLNFKQYIDDAEDFIGNGYIYLITKFASDSGKKGGEFFTPTEVSELIAKLVSPKAGDTIYDPTCGSASLLIKAKKESGTDQVKIYGQEKNGHTHSLAKMNMYLHDISDGEILRGDTIANPQHLENGDIKKFDVVVANPPFSLKKWYQGIHSGKGTVKKEDDKYRRFDEYDVPPKSRGDYAFVLHMIKSLNEEGTMATVVPHGVLFRSRSEGNIRQRILENNLVDAVIGLPENMFFGTTIPAAILVLKKNRKRKEVLFIDSSTEGNYEKGKNQNKLRVKDIEKIVETYKNYETIDKYSYVATFDEIEENDFNLNIPRYVDTFEEEEPVDMEKVSKEIKEIKEELKEVEAKMDRYIEELGL